MSEVMNDSKVKYNGEDIPVRLVEKRKDDAKRMRDSMRDLMNEERFWATTAHALGPLMMGLVIFTDASAGFMTMLMLMLTGGIYLYHHNTSEYVTKHARQAFALQFLGTFGWLFLVLSGTAVWVVLLLISIVLILLLVGLILTPLMIVLYPIFLVASFALPLSVVVLGTIGAWETWHGRDYRYPYIADRLDKWVGKRKNGQDLVVV